MLAVAEKQKQKKHDFFLVYVKLHYLSSSIAEKNKQLLHCLSNFIAEKKLLFYEIYRCWK